MANKRTGVKAKGRGRPRHSADGALQVYAIRLAPKAVAELKALAARIPGASPRALARDLVLAGIARMRKRKAGW